MLGFTSSPQPTSYARDIYGSNNPKTRDEGAPGKTSAILYNTSDYADNGERKADPACTHNPKYYVTWRGFAKARRGQGYEKLRKTAVS